MTKIIKKQRFLSSNFLWKCLHISLFHNYNSVDALWIQYTMHAYARSSRTFHIMQKLTDPVILSVTAVSPHENNAGQSIPSYRFFSLVKNIPFRIQCLRRPFKHRHFIFSDLILLRQVTWWHQVCAVTLQQQGLGFYSCAVLCGDRMFSLCLRRFSPCSPACFHSPKMSFANSNMSEIVSVNLRHSAFIHYLDPH